MRALATIPLALSVALLAAACGGDDGDGSAAETPTTTTTAAAGDALVVYERAGGVAYTEQRLVVEEDASATVEVQGFRRPVRFRLDDVAMDALDGLLRNAEDDLEDPPGLTECADCYVYAISHGGETASFDNTDMPAALRALVSFFDDLIARHTPSGPTRPAP